MIAIILSAGMGTRLMPLTKEVPKPLLKIENKTLLERMIDNCLNLGIDKYILVVGYNKDKVYDIAPILESEKNIKITIVENNDYEITNTSVSTYLASKYIEKENLDDDFILINGDNVVDPDIIKKIAVSDKSSMVVDNVKKLNEESFKLIINEFVISDDEMIANGKIKEIGKEIDISSSSGEFIGVSKVIKKDIPKFNEILIKLIDENKQNYYDFAFKNLSYSSQINYILTNGLKWTEIDDLNDWNFANELIVEFEE